MNENTNLTKYQWEYRPTELSTIRGSIRTDLDSGQKYKNVEILRPVTYYLGYDPNPHTEKYWFSFDLETGLVSVDDVTQVAGSLINPATEAELKVAREILSSL